MADPPVRLVSALEDRYRIERQLGEGGMAARNRQQYDVAPDDRHFVMIRDLGEDARGSVVYVENWFQELEARMAARR